MKQQINFRASDLAARQLAKLAEWWGTSQTETITTAIDRIYQQEHSKMVQQAMYGEVEPDTSFPTVGQTFYYHNNTTPLVDVGRVPGSPGIHVLRQPNGVLVAYGGYHLRREGETWTDVMNSLED